MAVGVQPASSSSPDPQGIKSGSARRGRAAVATISGTALLLMGWSLSGAMIVAAKDTEELSLVRDRGGDLIAHGGAKWSYDATLGPVHELDRIEVILEHPGARANQLEALAQRVNRGQSRLHLDTRSLPPGVMRVRASIDRRGGRTVTVSDEVVLGPFATRETLARDCNLGLGVSARAIRGVLLPRLREELESRLTEIDALGPNPELERVDVHLVDGGARVEISISAADRLSVDAVLDLAAMPPHRIAISLRSLDEVVFDGQTRHRAETGAAIVGAVLSGPLAPAGAQIGRKWMGSYISAKAREIATQRIEEGLRAVSELELVPAGFEALPGDPRSRLDIELCGPLELSPRQLGVGLRALPVWPDEAAPAPGQGPSNDKTHAATLHARSTRSPLPGPVYLGAHVSPTPLRDGEDVRIDVGIDIVNALLWSWTRSGLLLDLITSRGVLDAVNRELAPWTPLRAGDLHIAAPPILMVDAHDPSQWRIVWPAVELALSSDLAVEPPAPPGSEPISATRRAASSSDPERATDSGAQRKNLALTFAGRLAPLWQRGKGDLLLSGRLDDLAIRCERMDGDLVRMEPCLSAVLAALDLRARVDQRLQPEGGRLPAIHLGPLLDKATRGDTGVAWLDVEHPREDPTRIRIRAALDLGQSGHAAVDERETE